MVVSVSSISSNSISAPDVTGSLGPELQPNWDMSQGLLGITASEVTLQAVVDMGENAVLLTSTQGVFDRGNFATPSNGIVIGNSYKVRVRARRGVQGSNQAIFGFTWASVSQIDITSASYAYYEFVVVATAETGFSRVYAADGAGGAIGDEVYVSQLSIREAA